MLKLSSYQIPPPTCWQDFEDLCLDLWKSVWRDPNAQKNGRNGQPQAGVDVFGRSSVTGKIEGVQCKSRHNAQGESFSIKELHEEVENAKGFHPPLTRYYVATTGKRDAALQKEARLITEHHGQKNLFEVIVYAWDDIVALVEDFPDLISKHFAGLAATFSQLGAHKEIRQELEEIKRLIENYRPVTAWDMLISLRKRTAGTATEDIRRRILTLMAAAKIELYDFNTGGDLLIQAFDNPEDDNQKANAAFGHLILGHREKARDLASELTLRSPLSADGFAVLLQSRQEPEAFETELKNVPDQILHSPQVAHCIALQRRRERRFEDACLWFETASESAIGNRRTDILGDFASCLFDWCSSDPEMALVVYGQISARIRAGLEKARALFDEAWRTIAATEIAASRATWAVGLGIARTLLDKDYTPRQEVLTAYGLNPNDPICVRNRAALALDDREYQLAADLADKFFSLEPSPIAAELRVRALTALGRFQDGIAWLQERFNTDPAGVEHDVAELFVELLLRQGSIEKAENYAAQHLAVDPTDSRRHLLLIECVHRDSKEEPTRLHMAELARLIAGVGAPPDVVVRTADLFFSLKQYDDAVALYEKVVDFMQQTALSEKALFSYYRAGRYRQALTICESLQAVDLASKSVVEIQAAILEEQGDLVGAASVYRDHLSREPGDLETRIDHALVCKRLGDFHAVDELLNGHFDARSLPVRRQVVHAWLYAERNRPDDAADLMYEIRRTNADLFAVHRAYIGVILHPSYRHRPYHEPEAVAVNTAVRLKEPNGPDKWYLIDDRADAELSRNELHPTHPIAKRLLGRKVGDLVRLRDRPIPSVEHVIAEIVSKHTFAFRDSIDVIDRSFPDQQQFVSYRVSTAKSDATPEERLWPMAQILTDRRRWMEKAIGFYTKGPFTLGALSEVTGENAVALWEAVTSMRDVGFRAGEPTPARTGAAVGVLERGPALVLDTTAILTLGCLDLLDVARTAGLRMVTSTSTIEAFQERLEWWTNHAHDGLTTIFEDAGKLVSARDTAERVQRRVAELEHLIIWAKETCATVPCRRLLDLGKPKKDDLDGILHAVFADVVLIASEPEHVLFSDDERLRTLARSEWQIDGVWTQSFLKFLAKQGTLTTQQYHEATIKMVFMNYFPVALVKDDLEFAARQTAWTPDDRLKAVFRGLRRGMQDDNYVCSVAVGFLRDLWFGQLGPIQRNEIAMALLNCLVDTGAATFPLQMLRRQIAAECQLVPLIRPDLERLVMEWARTRPLW